MWGACNFVFRLWSHPHDGEVAAPAWRKDFFSVLVPRLPSNESSNHFDANAFTSSRIEPISLPTFRFSAALDMVTVLSM
jgi:hypothetical protein